MLRSTLNFILTMGLILSFPAFANPHAKAPEHPTVMTKEAETEASSSQSAANPGHMAAKSAENQASTQTQTPNVMPLEAPSRSAAPASHSTGPAPATASATVPAVNKEPAKTAVKPEPAKTAVKSEPAKTEDAAKTSGKEATSEKATTEKQATSEKQDKGTSEKQATLTPPASEEKASIADLEVVEFVLAGNVEGREPKDVVDSFAQTNERGFAFARLHAKAPQEVTFVWYRNDKPVARFKQPIQAAKKWRTYSCVTLRKGDWKVQLLSSDDKVLAEKTFTIE